MFGFIVGLGVALVGIIVSAVLLWISTRLFRLKNGSFANALSAAAIVGIVNFLLGYGFGMLPILKWFGGVINFVVAVLLGLLLVKRTYKLDGSKTFLVWLVWFILAFIAAAILSAIFAALFVSAALTVGAGSLLLG